MPLDFSRIDSTILAESGNYFPIFIRFDIVETPKLSEENYSV